ncbi:DinB family protein [Deinococcus sp.]|uniref:DinB family protein n=1 Tax=Deinococcus sp. TaxID=47478 RepID=UPI003B5B52AF
MTYEDEQRICRIEPQPPYTPGIGALVEMMAYARFTTLQAVEGLSVDELDAIPDNFTNSIGMLLAHIAATDKIYQYLSFEGLDPMEPLLPEYAPYVGAMTFGEQGEKVQGRTLEELLAELDAVRAVTLAEFARKDDAWLASRFTVPYFDYANHHWAWFHVMEDEVSHRGQMRLIRKALART